MTKPIWSPESEDHDYPAALSYLSLLAPAEEVQRIIKFFKSAPVELIKAKDVIRASKLPLLPMSNFHVQRDLKKIEGKKVLAPILLVRGIGRLELHLTIADGYHRACAVYWNNEDAFIHAKVANWA